VKILLQDKNAVIYAGGGAIGGAVARAYAREGAVDDPFGHRWSIATHVEDVPPEEMAERAKAAMAAMSS
jgi:NAD(P)-dependent dehydrogenase (short-subunit alcohol dehydrogenase family)